MNVRRHVGIFIIPALALVLFLGCRDRGEGGDRGRAPRVSHVKILPGSPEPGDVLTASASFETNEIDRSKVIFEYRWFVNGEEVEKGMVNKYTPAEMKEGDDIYVEVMARDTFGRSGWTRSKPVEVRIKGKVLAGVDIEPEKAYTDTSLRAVIDYGAVDPEETEVFYRWFVNGEEVFGEGDEVLSPEYFRQGDRVTVQICTDGFFEGVTLKTSWEREILNRNPYVISGPHFEVNEDRVIFWIEAEDPDGDELTYGLVSGPPGARLDPYTGEGVFKAIKGTTGLITVAIEARDPFGGWVRREGKYDLKLKEVTED
jgi:hypothetical protein